MLLVLGNWGLLTVRAINSIDYCLELIVVQWDFKMFPVNKRETRKLHLIRCTYLLLLIKNLIPHILELFRCRDNGVVPEFQCAQVFQSPKRKNLSNVSDLIVVENEYFEQRTSLSEVLRLQLLDTIVRNIQCRDVLEE